MGCLFAAGLTGRWNDDSCGIRRRVMRDRGELGHPFGRAEFAVVFEEHRQLRDVTLNDEAAEGRRITAGRRRFGIDIGLLIDGMGKLERRVADVREVCRSDR